ncbi:6-phosphogluconolactonase [Nitrosomonas sp. Is37]|uniref:6-phosphogluconolactonase n=1 Tax=Nitrosomonas sp. Is37 TaxID=3080535 RepID=UPI00294B1DEB|nr:6-phosphogluconolactonase [Nitrosomonas sp. Is37]
MLAHNMIERRFHNSMHELVAAFTDFATLILRNALMQNNKVSLVVPGGQTPRDYLPALARQALPWERVYITLSDERWVETQADASNERLVRNYFLKDQAEKAHFIGLKTSHAHSSEALTTVHERLCQLPRPFNLTVLGLGQDGHIASLFPGMILDQDTPYLCQAVEPPLAPSLRISLTLPALASSCHIALVVTGIAKRQLLDRLIKNPDPLIPFVQLMQQCQSPITVFETN